MRTDWVVFTLHRPMKPPTHFARAPAAHWPKQTCGKDPSLAFKQRRDVKYYLGLFGSRWHYGEMNVNRKTVAEWGLLKEGRADSFWRKKEFESKFKSFARALVQVMFNSLEVFLRSKHRSTKTANTGHFIQNHFIKELMWNKWYNSQRKNHTLLQQFGDWISSGYYHTLQKSISSIFIPYLCLRSPQCKWFAD